MSLRLCARALSRIIRLPRTSRSHGARPSYLARPRVCVVTLRSAVRAPMHPSSAATHVVYASLHAHSLRHVRPPAPNTVQLCTTVSPLPSLSRISLFHVSIVRSFTSLCPFQAYTKRLSNFAQPRCFCPFTVFLLIHRLVHRALSVYFHFAPCSNSLFLIHRISSFTVSFTVH